MDNLRFDGHPVTHSVIYLLEGSSLIYLAFRNSYGWYMLNAVVTAVAVDDSHLNAIAAVFNKGRDIPIIELGILSHTGEFVSRDVDPIFAREWQQLWVIAQQSPYRLT